MPSEENGSSMSTVRWRSRAFGAWSDLRKALVDESFTVAWIDGAGIHVDAATALPEARPFGLSHLWGWSDARRIRVRTDGATIAAAELDPDPDPEASAAGGGWSEVLSRVDRGGRILARSGAHAMMRMSVNEDVLDGSSDGELVAEVRSAFPPDRAPATFLRLHRA